MKQLTTKYCLRLFLVGAFLFSEFTFAQFTIPERPKDREQHFVYDYIDLLTAEEESVLETKLTNYADSTSTQIVIAIISTTKGEDISFLGAKWGQEWGIGQADTDNGILILLAKDDRTVDINTGYGIEYRITDRMAEQIINSYMVPAFKKGAFFDGLDTATDVAIQMLQGEFKGERKSDNFPLSAGVVFGLFILFLVIIISLSKKGGRGNGGNNGGMGSLLDVIILSNAGRTGGGWGGGSLGGGSFGGGGFGGGGFGGGGASGSW